MLDGTLPKDEQEACKLLAKASYCTIIDDILYRVDPQNASSQKAIVPSHLRSEILHQNHDGKMAGHFSGVRLFKVVSLCWWWDGIFKDAVTFANDCPQCAVTSGRGHVNKPPLNPIPVQRPFQILGVDIMKLPRTKRGNRYVIVFQDFFTKWPMVFSVPDQKSTRIARLIAEELIPLFGVPEAVLSDRGANLLSHLMIDLCELMGIRKLNTTAYHPQCNGMVERFNRTLKGMLRAHAAQFVNQWDQFLPGVLFAYRNMPHESTKEQVFRV